MPAEVFAMAITVEAVYENGVLKPAQPLPLEEHEKVRVTVEPTQPSLAERIAARARALPQETLDRLPADGALPHDHYMRHADTAGVTEHGCYLLRGHLLVARSGQSEGFLACVDTQAREIPGPGVRPRR
jgi:predicted DNA-binding antitoxin AbrB/MazE fold protein